MITDNSGVTQVGFKCITCFGKWIGLYHCVFPERILLSAHISVPGKQSLNSDQEPDTEGRNERAALGRAIQSDSWQRRCWHVVWKLTRSVRTGCRANISSHCPSLGVGPCQQPKRQPAHPRRTQACPQNHRLTSEILVLASLHLHHLPLQPQTT